MLQIIIQARTTSTRLPKKVLLPLCGMSVLEVMIKRLEKFKENIIIATTNDGTESEIIEIAKRHNIAYFQGSKDDVLERFYRCLEDRAKDDDTIVRLTSDCPFIDSEILQKCIDKFHNTNANYLSNVEKRSFPRGLDVEVFSFKILKEAHFNAKTNLEREHVTPYIRITSKEKFKIESYEDREDNSSFRLTLDEDLDYEVIKAVYQKLGCRFDFNYQKLIEVLKANQEIANLNKNVEQKKS